MKMMLTYRPIALLLLVIVASGCNRSVTDSRFPQNTSGSETATQSALTIQPASPAGVDSREPELTSTADGRIILSWVEKIGSKRYALRFATRDASSWSIAQTVAEGENWFINWADFPR